MSVSQMLCDELISGPCLAVEVCAGRACPPADVVPAFRQLCGPHVVEVARELAPGSLRARFGQREVTNAVHCTDLPTDGELECEYFFKLLRA